MRRSGVVGVAVAVLAAVLSWPAPPPAVAASGPAAAGTCPTFEAPIADVPPVANPFDPSEVGVDVTFTSPGGVVSTVPAFFDQDYTRALVSNRERLSASGAPGWRVRFTPGEPGTWTWRTSVAVDGGAPTVSDAATFTCALDPTSHGFLRRSSDDDRYLAWDDGTPYTALGENLSWYGARGTYDYDAWLDQLAAHGATWIRVWMPTWAFGLETITRDGSGAIVQSSLGDYTTRLDRAWQLDYVVEAARARGIVVQLVLQNHGPFSTTSNSEWADNPYNAANGGPLTTPTQFFTDPAAKDLFVRRMRYVVARWGYATNLVWEFWNEVDLTNASPADVIAWHAEMGDRLRALDPYDHLQTTSVDGALLSNPAAWTPLFALPQIDMSQLHFYGIGNLAPLDFTTFVPTFVAPLLALGKPMLVAEAGVDYRGPAETIAADPNGQGFHELLWTGLFSGGYGSGMTWWWDNVVHPLGQYPTFDGLGALLDGVALDREHFGRDGATATAATGALQAFPLRGDRTVLAWVRNPANWWHQPDSTPVEGGHLDLTGLASGTWQVELVDPYSAAVSDAGTVEVAGGVTSVPLPTFTREVAVRLRLVQPRRTFLECDGVAGSGKVKPGLTAAAQPVALSLRTTVAGSCRGDLVAATGPLTSLRGKVVGSMSCAATGEDDSQPLAGKLQLGWTATDAKGHALVSSMFVRLVHSTSVTDGMDVDNGLVVKGPGAGLDAGGGILVQPTRNKVPDLSTIGADGRVVAGGGSLGLAVDCAAGIGTTDSFVFGTDGTSLTGAAFDDGVRFSLPE
jgi:hypothetical protein